jgi:hypothetical protein
MTVGVESRGSSRLRERPGSARSCNVQKSRFSEISLSPVRSTGYASRKIAETHQQNRRLGYARISSYGQTLDARLEQLRGVECTKIYREKVTGAHNDRRELLEVLKHLAPGDVVTVTRIDRLARSTFDLFAIVKQIVDAKAQFRSPARGPTPAPAQGD